MDSSKSKKTKSHAGPSKAPALVQKLEERMRELSSEADLGAAMGLGHPEERFDRIARSAAFACGCPVGMISFISSGVAWNKACCGADAHKMDREGTFASYVAAVDELFVVEDALDDPRFASHPWVKGYPGLRFYAGHPIRDESGEVVGALSVAAHEPLAMGEQSARLIADMAAMAEGELRMSKAEGELADARRRELVANALPGKDDLTRLWNQPAMEELLKIELAKGMRGHATTVALVEIDGVTQAAALHGKAGFEELFRALADAVRHCMRDIDIVGRHEGFRLMMVISAADKTQAQAACERLRKFVQKTHYKGVTDSMRATVSIGAAVSSGVEGSQGAAAMESIVEAARAALESARAHKNKIIFSDTKF